MPKKSELSYMTN